MVTNFFQSKEFKRLIILIVIAAMLYAIRDMLNLVLIMFIFTFLMNQLQKFITKRLDKIVKINPRIIVAILYIAFVTCFVLVIIKYLPVIIEQVNQLIAQVKLFYAQPQDNEIVNYIITMTKDMDITKYLDQGVGIVVQYATNIGKVGIQVFIALILSLFILLEKERIIRFTSQFQDSKASAIYEELAYFGRKFVNSFGKVIEAQFVIAVVNCILSVIALWFMGFPQLLGLGIMIFLLGLIPVAGVVISLFPLCTIAYSIGGFMHVIYILIFIAIIHALESYVLNPKLMSAKTNLPIFYTFIVLIFSEHFMGIWGLIIGIPIFMFLLDVLEVENKDIGGH
ncbi:AI-2E family transporter [Paenibacillus sp. N1-5-1-14]|uniref:AI-2E family transporter n=1 Tax=Paenibacillus radicibacter TaxID=2972488 RepID=UPI002159320A|nr:AI-2E family transporter [Paenibacillus radicibacter]MCR8643227.1 AI-2E family transporter [Paenibacillus radicibacter]